MLLDRLGAQSSTGGDADVSSTAKQATVAGTNGDGLRCRSSASSSASVVTVIREGAVVNLRSGSSGQWQAVSCGGTKGYVSNEYLSYGGVTAKSQVTAAATSDVGTAVVSGTNGDGLVCRAKGSYEAAVLMTIREGTTLKLRGVATKAGWQPVRCGSIAGYVRVDYLGNYTNTSSGGSSGGSSSSSSSGSAKVTGTGGSGVRLRSREARSASIITVVPEGATVTLAQRQQRVVDGRQVQRQQRLHPQGLPDQDILRLVQQSGEHRRPAAGSRRATKPKRPRA